MHSRLWTTSVSITQELIRNAASLAPSRLPESEYAFSQDAQMIYWHIHVWEALAYIFECQQPNHRDPEGLNQSSTDSAWTSAWHTVGIQMCVQLIEWEWRKRREKKKKTAWKCKTTLAITKRKRGRKNQVPKEKGESKHPRASTWLVEMSCGPTYWPEWLVCHPCPWPSLLSLCLSHRP